jgi:23S rRNA (adenine2503-C2)-methyltransferase
MPGSMLPSPVFSPGTGAADCVEVSVARSSCAQALKKRLLANNKAQIHFIAVTLTTNAVRSSPHLSFRAKSRNLCWRDDLRVVPNFWDGQSRSLHRMNKIDIKSLQLDELRALAQPSYRGGQIADWLYKKRAGSFEEMTDLPADLRASLVQTYSLGKIDIVRVLGSRDTTQKFLFRLTDGSLIESVLIPASPALYGSRSDRRTICVSTQVGCAYGCKFCASGLEGFSRNLLPNEIVDQLIAVERESGEKIDNVVFMGMGEPLANFENLMRAIHIINAPWGLGIGARHITVSTSGLVPQIRQLADEPLQIRLAISLHGATDDVRDRIMPINKRYKIDMLMSACEYYTSRKKQRLTFEYILIAGVNDSDEQAHLLAKHTRRVSAKVNLIPYNTVAGLPWTRPTQDRQERFLSILREHDVAATLRREKGHDIDAACGQLRLQTQRELQRMQEAAPQTRLV